MNPAIYYERGGYLQIIAQCISTSDVALIVDAVVFMYDTLKTDLQIQNWAGASLLLKHSFSSCFQIQWDKQNRHLEEQLSEHRYQVNARHQLRRRREKHSTTSFNLHFFRALAGFLCAYQQNRAQSRLLNLLIINCLIRRWTI